MVTEPRAAPALEPADLDLHPIDPARRHEHVVDVVSRPVLGAVAPVEGRHALFAVQLAVHRVPGADQPEFLLEDANLGRMVDAPAWLIPDGVAVEVTRDQRRRMAEELVVARQRPPER